LDTLADTPATTDQRVEVSIGDRERVRGGDTHTTATAEQRVAGIETTKQRVAVSVGSRERKGDSRKLSDAMAARYRKTRADRERQKAATARQQVAVSVGS